MGTAVVGVGAVDLTLLGFGVDSSFQNLSEYIGAILAVIGQVVLGLSRTSIALRSDSVTALTWAIAEGIHCDERSNGVDAVMYCGGHQCERNHAHTRRGK